MDGEEITRFSVTIPDRRSGRVPDALDAAAQGLLFDLDDSGWPTDPELPPAWTAFEGWFIALQEGGGVEGDLEGQEPLPPEFATLYAWSLNGYHPALATSITSTLTLIGRITGNEIDREWLDGSHPCMSIPWKK
ncbi:hypothetical protein [Nonomuraea sp. NPDC049504]|uniref:hypothetical protein n=1 Tax=Nonomuraea sp. NPDC049504 TaxID=3154729 RepID=UPI003436C562